jgi:hypothetical protein
MTLDPKNPTVLHLKVPKKVAFDTIGTVLEQLEPMLRTGASEPPRRVLLDMSHVASPWGSTTGESSQMPTTLTSKSPDMQTIRLVESGPDLSGRALGAAIRESIQPGVPSVVFDCTGVESMSPSFADEVFGKLSAQPGRPPMQIVNATPDIIALVRFAIGERNRR